MRLYLNPIVNRNDARAEQRQRTARGRTHFTALVIPVRPYAFRDKAHIASRAR